MKKTLSLVAFALLSASTAHALDARIVRQLDALAPNERREQRCDIEAMDRIRKEGDFRPDKVIAYTFADPIESGNSIRAPGAVFRSRGDWYHFSFRCTTSDDHFEVLSFRYEVGAKIARDQWDELNLFP